MLLHNGKEIHVASQLHGDFHYYTRMPNTNDSCGYAITNVHEDYIPLCRELNYKRLNPMLYQPASCALC